MIMAFWSKFSQRIPSRLVYLVDSAGKCHFRKRLREMHRIEQNSQFNCITVQNSLMNFARNFTSALSNPDER